MPDRRPKATEIVTVRLPEELVSDLSRMAHRVDRTFSDYVRAVLSVTRMGMHGSCAGKNRPAMNTTCDKVLGGTDARFC